MFCIVVLRMVEEDGRSPTEYLVRKFSLLNRTTLLDILCPTICSCAPCGILGLKTIVREVIFRHRGFL